MVEANPEEQQPNNQENQQNNAGGDDEEEKSWQDDGEESPEEEDETDMIVNEVHSEEEEQHEEIKEDLPEDCFKVLQEGEGELLIKNNRVKMHFIGYWGENHAKKGEQFVSSYDDLPADFVVGNHQVIDGWDKAALKMKRGGKYEVKCPARFAYGKHGAGDAIPPDTDLSFTIEVLRD